MSDRRSEPSRSVSEPQPGLFLVRLVRGGPWVPASIAYVDGCWSATIDGKPCGPPHPDPVHADGVFRVWMSGRMTTQAEYDHQGAMKAWATEHQPTHPAANPTSAIDIRQRKPFF